MSARAWVQGYRREWLRADLVAGLTTAAVVVPKAMAYAGIVGLPLEVGLYTALVPLVVYAAFGTSRALSVTTTTTLAILTAGVLAETATTGDAAALMGTAATLAMLVGALLLLAGVLRIGFIANFISDPVLAGFKAGIGLVIVVDQVPKLLGVHLGREPFFPSLVALASRIPETSVPSLVLGAAMLVLILGLERFAPRSPGPLVAIIVAIAAAWGLDLQAGGIELVGAVRAGLPVPAFPDLAAVGVLWPGALGIALMSFVESIAAGRAFVRSDEPLPQPNRELIATGLANLLASGLQSMPAGGGTSQTAVNRAAGARSQVSGLVTALVVLATLVFLGPVIGFIPNAALAAVVVATSIPLLRPAEFRAIRQVRTTEFRWALVALAGVLVLGTLMGILLAIAVSVLVLMHQANNPPVYLLGRKPGTDVFRALTDEHPEDETFPGLLIVRTEGRLHFANVQRAGEKVWPLIHAARPRVVALDLDAVPDIEYTALRGLSQFERKLAESGVALWLVGLNAEVRRVVERAPLGQILTKDRTFEGLGAVVDRFRVQFGQPGTGRPRSS